MCENIFFIKLLIKKRFHNIFIKVIKKTCENDLFSVKYLIKTFRNIYQKKCYETFFLLNF
jgi:hypothetical protein